MIRRQLFRTAVGLLAATLSLVGVQAVAAPAASADAAVAVRTIYYDASRAGEFATNFSQAAAIWNARATNVRLVAGSPASVTIYVDSGWPRAYVNGLGAGRIYMGWQAVNEGYNRTRIATHEWGHILGLPDRRTGLCSDLMSGSSAPVSCTNAYPNATEVAQVQRNFANGLAVGAKEPAVAGTYAWRPF